MFVRPSSPNGIASLPDSGTAPPQRAPWLTSGGEPSPPLAELVTIRGSFVAGFGGAALGNEIGHFSIVGHRRQALLSPDEIPQVRVLPILGHGLGEKTH